MGTRLPLTLKYDKSLDFELRTERAQMVYSVSQQGPPADRDEDLHISPGTRVWLGSHSSRTQDEATTLANGADQLQSLFPDASSPPLGVNADNPLLLFASISPSGLDSLDKPFIGSL
ncbi:unnamed protein product [Rhizoctonia solani]|uniref:Uncharacterized protein n=1 Tax=Rhizoctonia solani TaxID=456999 RepID=A0A8H3DQP2_9AGAM|nr:unnamed protein product [Rhizoctonia solani]